MSHLKYNLNDEKKKDEWGNDDVLLTINNADSGKKLDIYFFVQDGGGTHTEQWRAIEVKPFG